MENTLSEIDWTPLVWFPGVSESFMQRLAHNLSIRWMDGPGGGAGGGTIMREKSTDTTEGVGMQNQTVSLWQVHTHIP